MDQASTMLLDRSIEIVENRLPELAERYMHVPLDYYTSEEFDARERQLFMTQPRALLASNEIANPHDYHVRMAMGRSILLTRDAEGKAHAFLNYCRHRGAEPASGCGNAARLSCPCSGRHLGADQHGPRPAPLVARPASATVGLVLRSTRPSLLTPC